MIKCVDMLQRNKLYFRMFRNIFTICLLGCMATVAVAAPPITGQEVEKFAPLDAKMLALMSEFGGQAATLAVMHRGELLYSRGYGYCDGVRAQPTGPDTLMRIASCTKPITAAAVLTLIRDQKFDRNTKVFDYLQLKPASEWGDPQLPDITIGQLLDHRGGWDRELVYDPVFELRQVEKTLKLKKPARADDIVKFMLTQPLQFEPGERKAYSNFGYTLLGRVIEKATGKTYFESIDALVLRPHQIEDIRLAHDSISDRPKREVWYPPRKSSFSVEPLDSCGGLIASAPALCQFMEHYWISGEPRVKGSRGVYYFFGSLPNTTALVCQRNDGYQFAALFNVRRDDHYKEDDDKIKAMLSEELDEILKED